MLPNSAVEEVTELDSRRLPVDNTSLRPGGLEPLTSQSIDHRFTGLFCDDVRTAVNHNDEKFVNLIHFVDSIYYFTACMELIKIFYNYIQHMRNLLQKWKGILF